MKANLYKEEVAACDPINEQQMAVASEKPEKVNAPRPEYYIVNYKALAKPTLIALGILAVFVAAVLLF